MLNESAINETKNHVTTVCQHIRKRNSGKSNLIYLAQRYFLLSGTCFYM